MSLRRVRLFAYTFVSAHFYCKTSLKSQVLAFKGKSLTYFVNMYCAHRFCRTASCFSRTVCKYRALLLTTISLISYFLQRLSLLYFEKVLYFAWRLRYVSSINLIELMYLHFPNFVFFLMNNDRRGNEKEAYLRILFAFSGLF